MASDWPIVRLGDVIETNLGKMLDAKKNKGEFKPYLGNSNVRWGLFELDNLAEMRFEDHEDERYRLRNGDLVICEGGEPGRCAIWRDELPEMRIQKALHRVRAKQGLTNHYLYYWINLAARTGVLEPYFTGTTIKHLTGRALAELRLPLPPMSVQMDVVDVLGAIDARIDNLRQTNVTLESIAQALFKSWFVDFDPVRAKAEGREPEGMDAATAALFPGEFEDSELGPIPKGWQVRSLDSIAQYLNGLALQKFPPESESEYLPVIKIAQLRAGNTNSSDKASAHLKPEYIVEDGDVLFSWSGSLEVEVWCGGHGALNQHLFKVTSNEVPKWFYYLATRQHLLSFREIAAHKATTMGHIQRRHLAEAKVALPPTDILEKLSTICEPLFERRVANSLQAKALSRTRDTLLPRLISGKLCLPK